MSDTQARVSVRILEKEYAMTCPYEERSALLDSAEFLNARMREVRDSGKVVGSDRIAVMVALNLANEYLKLKEENRALRQRHETLTNDRAGLLQKNEQVRARVEAMIGRLKTMEHGA